MAEQEKKVWFFHAQAANRQIAGQSFQVYAMHGGSPWGLFETDDQAVADAVRQAPNVEEVSKEFYESNLQKKSSLTKSFKPIASMPPQQAAIKNAGHAVEVGNPPESAAPAPPDTKFDSAEDALSMGDVADIQTPGPAEAEAEAEAEPQTEPQSSEPEPEPAPEPEPEPAKASKSSKSKSNPKPTESK